MLELLQKSYLGKVKLIYIDPPYNTGNDFIYPDNYAESLQTYLEYTGQVDAQPEVRQQSGDRWPVPLPLAQHDVPRGCTSRGTCCGRTERCSCLVMTTRFTICARC